MSKRERKYSFKAKDIWNLHIDYTFGGFHLKFTGKTDSNAEIKGTIEFHFCDIIRLADELWKVINDRQSKINLISKRMKGES